MMRRMEVEKEMNQVREDMALIEGYMTDGEIVLTDEEFEGLNNLMHMLMRKYDMLVAML